MSEHDNWFEVVIPMEPVAKGRPRATRLGRIYTPKGTRNAEAQMRWAIEEKLKRDYPNHARPLFDGPCTLMCNFIFARPKTSRKDFHTVKPDCDNLAKSICDSLNTMVFADDSQVVHLVVSKRYCTERESPHVVAGCWNVCSESENRLPTKARVQSERKPASAVRRKKGVAV